MKLWTYQILVRHVDIVESLTMELGSGVGLHFPGFCAHGHLDNLRKYDDEDDEDGYTIRPSHATVMRILVMCSNLQSLELSYPHGMEWEALLQVDRSQKNLLNGLSQIPGTRRLKLRSRGSWWQLPNAIAVKLLKVLTSLESFNGGPIGPPIV